MKKETKTTTVKSEAKTTLPLFNQAGEEVGKIDLAEGFFETKVNEDLLAQVVRVYQTNSHQGTSKVKIRSEVRGGGRKPWRQKGTGRARTGSIRGAQWRGGGIIFGPVPHKTVLSINKKMKAQALLEALKLRVQNANLSVVDQLKFETPKTKDANTLVKKLNLTGKVLVVTDTLDTNNVKSFKNMQNVKIEEARNVNALDVLYYNNVLATKDAVSFLSEKVLKDNASNN